VLLGSGLTVLSQPLMYVKVLVQVGYEPLPPTLGRNVFGRQVYQLPGLFAYGESAPAARLPRPAGPVVARDGTGVGAFRGGGSSLPDASFPLQPGASKKEPVSSLEQVLKEVRRRRVLGSARVREGLGATPVPLGSLPAASPGTLSAFATIYREEGVLGFFAGLIPRLLGDILSLWLCNMLAYLINTYALENGVAARLRGGLKAPFLLPQVSTMAEMKSYSQAVTGVSTAHVCVLAGGLLPYAPTYSSWLDCWSQLHREGNMSRGNSLFFRKVPTGKRYVWE
ncbi:UNVERIFIED_CONTAM: hypothetical protein FQV16_0011703, partial [Eudyptes robustus]